MNEIMKNLKDEASMNSLSKDLMQMKDEMEKELKSILDFWSNEVFDQKTKRFVGKIDHYGKKYLDAPVGCVMMSRMLWSFSAAYKFTGYKPYRDMANEVYQFLIDAFWDQQYGALFWEVDDKGRAIDQRKQAYAQGFGILALSEYYSAVKNKQALDFAMRLYQLLEKEFYDELHGGYIEALDRKWQPVADLRLSSKEANDPKTMNTHLHILEPYTNLYKVWPVEKLKISIEKLINVFLQKIIDPDSGHFNLFFDLKWHVKSSVISFGHDIEGAWLLHEAVQVTANKTLLNAIRKASLALVELTIKEGMADDSSIFNESENKVLDRDKHWWPQAEAMVGLIDAWEIDKKTEYLVHLQKIWGFIKKHLIDDAHGEWFWRVDGSGNVITTEDKAGFWKCPYHNSRALMEVIRRIDKRVIKELI